MNSPLCNTIAPLITSHFEHNHVILAWSIESLRICQLLSSLRFGWKLLKLKQQTPKNCKFELSTRGLSANGALSTLCLWWMCQTSFWHPFLWVAVFVIIQVDMTKRIRGNKGYWISWATKSGSWVFRFTWPLQVESSTLGFRVLWEWPWEMWQRTWGFSSKFSPLFVIPSKWYALSTSWVLYLSLLSESVELCFHDIFVTHYISSTIDTHLVLLLAFSIFYIMQFAAFFTESCSH